MLINFLRSGDAGARRVRFIVPGWTGYPRPACSSPRVERINLITEAAALASREDFEGGLAFHLHLLKQRPSKMFSEVTAVPHGLEGCGEEALTMVGLEDSQS
jgi:hypothetical protein